MRRLKCTAVIAGLVTSAVISAVLLLFSDPGMQCVNYYYARQSVLSRLSQSDALSFKNVHTLDDDFDESTLSGRLSGQLSKVCPHWFEYTENGKVKNVDIHGGAVFYSDGPVH